MERAIFANGLFNTQLVSAELGEFFANACRRSSSPNVTFRFGWLAKRFVHSRLPFAINHNNLDPHTNTRTPS